MAIVVEGTATLYENASSTSAIVTVPTGAVVGELLLAAVTSQRATTGEVWGVPAGWVEVTGCGNIKDSTATGMITGLYSRIVTGTEAATYTWTHSAAGRTSGAMQRFSGVDATTMLDVAAGIATGIVQLPDATAPSITSVTAGALLISLASLQASTSTDFTTPSGMTLINTGGSVSGRRQSWAWEALPTAGATGGRVWTKVVATAGSQWTATNIALRPAAAAAGTAVHFAGVGTLGVTATIPVAATLTHRIVGPTGIVAVQTADATSVRLKVGTDTAVTTGVTYTAALTPDAVGNTHHQTSLSAGTYYYRVMMTDGGGESADTAGTVGRLLIAPTGQTSFSFCFGSDHHIAGDSPAMAAIATRQDSLFLICGDLYNPDDGNRAVSAYRTQMASRVEYPNYQAVLATIPSVYTAGDHCYGMENDSTGTTVPSAVAPHNQVFREFWPCDPYQATTGEYFTFAWGRCRFIMFDAHTWKSAYTATDNSSKTMLGTVQKQWVKDTITASAEPVIFFAQHYAWTSSPVTNDGSWSGYTTERNELSSFMVASGKHCVALHGDMHAVAWCDGNSYAQGILDLDGSCLSAPSSQKGSPWNQIYPSSGTANVSQYGRVVVTDSGTQIAVAFTGYSSNNTSRVTTTDTFTLPVTVTASVPLAGTSSVTVAAGVTHPAVVAVAGSSTLGVAATTFAVRTATVPVVGSGTVGVAASRTVTPTVTIAGTSSVGVTATTFGTQTATVPLAGAGTVTVTPLVTHQSPITITGVGTVGVAASVFAVQAATVAVTGTNTVAVTPTRTVPAAVPLSGTSTIGVTPTTFAVQSATVPITGTGTLTVTPTRTVPTPVPLTGGSTVTVTATTFAVLTASVPITGGGTIGVTGTTTGNNAIPLVGTSTLTVTGAATIAAAVPITGTNTVAVAPAVTIPAVVAATGTGTVTVTAGVTHQAGAAIVGSSTLSVTTTRTVPAVINMTGASVVAIAVLGTATAIVPITGTSAVTISGPVPVPPITITGTNQVTVTATVSITAAATLAGASIIAAVPLITHTPTVTITGANTIGVIGTAAGLNSIPITGTSTVTITGLQTITATVAVTGAGIVTVTPAAAVVTATVTVTGSSTVTVAAQVIRASPIPLTGSNTITVAVTRTIYSPVTITGTGSVTVGVLGVTTATVTITGSSALTVAAVVAHVPTITITGGSIVGVATTIARIAVAAILGGSALTVTGTGTTRAAALLAGINMLTVTGLAYGQYQIVRHPAATITSHTSSAALRDNHAGATLAPNRAEAAWT